MSEASMKKFIPTRDVSRLKQHTTDPRYIKGYNHPQVNGVTNGVEHTDPLTPNIRPEFTGHENDLSDEIQRIRTFSGWPPSAHVTPYELAKGGFIYMGVSDRVKCVYCGQILENWERGDTVQGEHRKYSPFCPLLASQEQETRTTSRKRFWF